MADEPEPGAPRKQLSGGKKAGNKRRMAKLARLKRQKKAEKTWLEQMDGLGAPPKGADSAHGWLGRAAVLIVRATLLDVAIPPEQMRRDAMKQIEQASKVLDPAKLTEQLEELERALEEMRNARDISPRQGSAPSARADLL